MNIIGIIPARFGSTRFPGKPLADINGKTMIQRVYEQCKSASRLNDVIIATDDERIMKHVQSFGGKVIMSDPQHSSGTDRCSEIIQSLSEKPEVIINIQGDEPFIQPEQIDLLCGAFANKDVNIGTLVKKIITSDELFNHNTVKVVVNKNEEAVYFSRLPIPYNRNFPEDEWLKNSIYYKHIGIYGYRRETLLNITRLEKTNLEIAESLEQLRWIENGYKIHVKITSLESVGIDTPEDLRKVQQ
jgi:3-deoxy-manno-octulosonate cytidylyltransferase (CMP-KDO synthetase)